MKELKPKWKEYWEWYRDATVFRSTQDSKAETLSMAIALSSRSEGMTQEDDERMMVRTKKTLLELTYHFCANAWLAWWKMGM